MREREMSVKSLRRKRILDLNNKLVLRIDNTTSMSKSEKKRAKEKKKIKQIKNHGIFSEDATNVMSTGPPSPICVMLIPSENPPSPIEAEKADSTCQACNKS